MHDRQSCDGNDDHWTFEDHECSLVVRNFAREATFELSNTVDATDVDRDRCESKTCIEKSVTF